MRVWHKQIPAYKREHGSVTGSHNRHVTKACEKAKGRTATHFQVPIPPGAAIAPFPKA